MSLLPYPFAPRYLPAKSVCNKNDTAGIAEYEAMTDEQKKVRGGLWWSMHDIVEVFGGFIKEENDANYFNYVIDLSSPEIAEAKMVDSALVAEIQKDLDTNFTPLSQQIQTEFQTQQLSAASSQQAAVLNVAAASRPMAFPAQPGTPGVAQPMQVGLPGAVQGEPAYSVKNLEAACLRNISRIPITSKSRIFVVSKDLTPATSAMLARINSKGDFELLKEQAPTGLNLNEVNNNNNAQGINLGPAPGVTTVGGRITKTRKGKKIHKKRKTRRNKRQPLKKVGPKK